VEQNLYYFMFRNLVILNSQRNICFTILQPEAKAKQPEQQYEIFLPILNNL